MNKIQALIGGVALIAAGAATAGDCSKDKVAGRYIVEATSQESARYWVGHGMYRVFLSKQGGGTVTAFAESFNGMVAADNVSWSVEWDVFPDCTGYLFIDNDLGGGEGVFGVAGPRSNPVLMGVIADGDLSGKMRAERIRF